MEERYVAMDLGSSISLSLRSRAWLTEKMKKRNLALGLFLFMIILRWSSVSAESPFEKGVTVWGFSAGIGNNFHVGGNVAEDVEFYVLAPRWGKVLTERVGPGVLEFDLEGFLSYVRQNSRDRYAMGITSFAVYNSTDSGKMIPFLELGGGVLYTDLDPENFGSHFNFTLQAGIGLRYEIADHSFLRFSYRIQHISNAGLDEDNASIDSNFLFIGISVLR